MQDKTRQAPETDEFIDIRSRDEATMREKVIDAPDVSTLPAKELQALVHELQVHQIELEAQNAELKRGQLALEESRNNYQDKYLDLYDFSPVGYFTLTHKGIIREVNLTGANLLGMSRPNLVGRCLGHFVAPECVELWDSHIFAVLGSKDRQTCDLNLKSENGLSFYARLDSVRKVATAEPQEANSATFEIRMAIIDTTDRRRMEELQSVFRQFYASLSSLFAGVLVVTTQGRVEFVNQAFCDLYHLDEPPESLVGLEAPEMISKISVAYADPVWAVSRITDIVADGQPVKGEEFAIRDGRIWMFDYVPITVDGKLYGRLWHHQDITERKLAEKALLESQNQLATVFRNSPSAIVIVSAIDGKYVEVNETYLSLTGFTRDEVIGHTSEELEIFVDHSDRDKLVSRILKEGSVRDMEIAFLVKSEHIVIGSISGSAIEIAGKTHFIYSILDITERKQLESERLNVQQKLLHAQKLESLGVMAGGIAHDFNNLLMAILGNLEFALTVRNLGPEVRRSIERAIQASERSAELSRQMLIYSGSAYYAPKDLDLNEIANKLTHENERLLKSVIPQTTTLNFKIDKGLPLIRGNEDQIQRVITNLVINSSEAIGENTGDVTITTGVMDCDESYLSRSRLEEKPEPGEFVFVEVTDTGCGMDAETQHKLFDPFFTTKFWGRGLGMAEVMGTLKGHHGAIIVESEVGKGTTIRVLFPSSEKGQTPFVEIQEVGGNQPSVLLIPSSRKTILVVEDEEFVRDMVLVRLEVLGYDTIPAVDGAEGVHLFRERMNEIDLVLLDFAMPRMNGVEAFGELRRMRPDVKVILSSGYTEDAVSKSFPGPKPAGFLSKPYKLEALKAELDRLLGIVG